MRELTVRIRFTKHCLGNVKKSQYHDKRKYTFFALPRTPEGQITFLPSWWKANMSFAAEVLSRHLDTVKDISFEMFVDGKPDHRLYRRYFEASRYALHEAFWPGQVVGFNAVVPASINDEDFLRLLDVAGRFRGISPAKPKDYGFFVVDSIESRRLPEPVASPAIDEPVA